MVVACFPKPYYKTLAGNGSPRMAAVFQDSVLVQSSPPAILELEVYHAASGLGFGDLGFRDLGSTV